MPGGCVFCKIAAGEIPATIVKRGDGVLAFKDLNPQAPTHLLVIPTHHVATLNETKDAALLGKLLGFEGIRVERPEDIAGAWSQALHADRPFVLEAIVDTNVPPLPPHITTEQAGAITRALVKGDPDRAAIIRQTFRDLIEDFVPHRS